MIDNIICEQVAKKALLYLMKEIKKLPLIIADKDKDDAYKTEGDIVDIWKPIKGKTVDGSKDISPHLLNLDDGKKQISLEYLYTYKTDLNLSLAIPHLYQQIVIPVVDYLVEDINSNFLELNKNISSSAQTYIVIAPTEGPCIDQYPSYLAFNGDKDFSIRVTIGYDINRCKNRINFIILYGMKAFS